MRWPKLLSALLHPIVMPTIGILLYFILSPMSMNKEQQFTVLGIVFIATYIIPLLLLFFLKSVGLIKSFEVFSIKERKIPLFFMITLLYFLGRLFSQLAIVRDLSYLFYGIVLALIITYFLFYTGLKSSLHLMSMGGATAYFLVFQLIHQVSTLAVVAVFVILSGFLAAARLHLKAHTTREVYIGFFLGFSCQFLVYFGL